MWKSHNTREKVCPDQYIQCNGHKLSEPNKKSLFLKVYFRFLGEYSTNQCFLWNHCKFQWFWRDHCKFSMVFEETITIECFLGGLTIAINGFTMVFWCCYHRFQWFLMVPDHWSNDAMVSMDRCGLPGTNTATRTSPNCCQYWAMTRRNLRLNFEKYLEAISLLWQGQSL